MPTVSALGTNYNLPNYHGRVHQLTPADTPLTTAIMSASGLEIERARTFEWTTFDLRTAAQNTVVDGDSAGTPENRSRWRTRLSCAACISTSWASCRRAKACRPS